MFEKSEQPKPAEPEPNLNRDMEEQLHAAVKKYDGTFICVVDGLLKKMNIESVLGGFDGKR
jgi:hypothetical protein